LELGTSVEIGFDLANVSWEEPAMLANEQLGVVKVVVEEVERKRLKSRTSVEIGFDLANVHWEKRQRNEAQSRSVEMPYHREIRPALEQEASRPMESSSTVRLLKVLH
jgi:hypothetical protein